MGGTKPIESGVKAMALRSAVESTVSGAIGTNSFDINPMKAEIGQKIFDKKATTFLTTTVIVNMLVASVHCASFVKMI